MPETVVPEMLRSPENWDKVAEYVRATREGGGLSIVESSPVPRQGGRQRPVAWAAHPKLKLYLQRESCFGTNC